MVEGVTALPREVFSLPEEEVGSTGEEGISAKGQNASQALEGLWIWFWAFWAGLWLHRLTCQRKHCTENRGSGRGWGQGLSWARTTIITLGRGHWVSGWAGGASRVCWWEEGEEEKGWEEDHTVNQDGVRVRLGDVHRPWGRTEDDTRPGGPEVPQEVWLSDKQSFS